MLQRLRNWHRRDAAERYRHHPITVTAFVGGRETSTRTLESTGARR